jgi:hypothetical protein
MKPVHQGGEEEALSVMLTVGSAKARVVMIIIRQIAFLRIRQTPY